MRLNHEASIEHGHGLTDPGSRLSEPVSCRACTIVRRVSGAALVLVMGGIFAAAWMAPAFLHARLPVLSGMGLNTALAFAIAGMALLLPRHRRGLGGLVAAMGAMVIAQYALAWMPPDGFWRMALNVEAGGDPWPRRMAPLSAAALLLAGLALATLDRPRSLYGQMLLQAVPGLIVVAAAGGMLNRSLDGLLFAATIDRYAVMSLPSMLGLCVLVAGYVAAMVETPWFRRFYAAREERQALAIGLTGFTAALLLGGAAAVAVLGKQMQATVEAELARSVQSQAAMVPLIVSSTLHTLRARAAGAQARPELAGVLRGMAGAEGAAWLEGADGSTVLRAGRAPEDSRLRVPIDEADQAWLIRDRGWMLEMRFPAARGRGSLVVQEPLPELARLLAGASPDSGETRLCTRGGGDMACFPLASMPHPTMEILLAGEAHVPMRDALAGKHGVTIAPDSRGVLTVAAYAPVTDRAWGLVRTIDAETMYQPIRSAVWRAIAIIAGIGMIAALLIYLRVQAVARLAVETGRQLRGVLDALPVGVWITDASGRIVLSNPASDRIWGGTRWDGIDPFEACEGWGHDTGKRIDASDWALARALRQGETSLDEVVDIACGKGGHKTIAHSALPLRDENGAITGAVAVSKDITARIRALEDVRRLKREFHSLAENLPDIVCRFDRDLRPVYANPEIEAATGMSREFLLGKTHAELGMPDGQAETWTRALRRVFDSGAPEVFEFSVATQDGSVRDYHVRAVAECDASGNTASVLTIARDISSLKGAEAVLRESEERLNGITSNVPGMVFQCYRNPGDDALHFSYISQGARWLLGLDAAAVLRNGSGFAGFIVPEDARSFRESLARSQETLAFWNWEGRIVTGDGDTRWVNLRATPRRGGDGACLWDGVAINVTESKLGEEKLVDSQRMLRELSAHLESVREEERKRIAREIHDELGQTLTALRMDVSLARLGFGESNPELLARLQSMTQLVDRTIRTARHVTSSLRPGALDLGIVAALEWLVEEFIGYAGIPCELVLGDGDFSLDELTATAIFRITQESLTNIARHAEATSVEIIVTRSGGWLCIEVRDNGRGFDPLSQASRKSFGLAGIRERVAMMEGTFELDSAPGRGTRIRVCVPMA